LNLQIPGLVQQDKIQSAIQTGKSFFNFISLSDVLDLVGEDIYSLLKIAKPFKKAPTPIYPTG
jgi:hypothetical protein